MSELLTQRYLRDGGTLATLESAYGICAKRHGEFPNLVFLKYDQLTSPMQEPIVQECRGLILDEADDWRVVSFPFRKFFNAGEGHAATIDWSTTRVYEKLDGSLMTMFGYRGQWRVASNGTPDGGGKVYGHKGTFADLFWETFNDLGYRLPTGPDDDDCGYSYMFELMTPWNRVVVPHAKPRLVFLGTRTLDDLREHGPEGIGAEHLGWEIVKSFPLTTAEECISAAAAMNPMECEGYVVCDADFNRVKMKCPQYVALSRLKESMSPRHMLDLVRRNEGDEFLSYFPEMRPLYEQIQERFTALCDEVDADYARLADIPEQKAFALEAVKTRCSSALFTIRAGKAKAARDYFAAATLPATERAVGVEDIGDDALLMAVGRGEPTRDGGAGDDAQRGEGEGIANG